MYTIVTAKIGIFSTVGKGLFEVRILKEVNQFQNNFRGVREIQEEEDMVPVPNQAQQKSLQILAAGICREYLRSVCDRGVVLIREVVQAPELLQNSRRDRK